MPCPVASVDRSSGAAPSGRPPGGKEASREVDTEVDMDDTSGRGTGAIAAMYLYRHRVSKIKDPPFTVGARTVLAHGLMSLQSSVGHGL